MIEKYTLDFVNKGKPFSMPVWSTIRQKEVDTIMSEYEEWLSGTKKEIEDYHEKHNYMIALVSLQQIDPNVKESDLTNMNLNDLVELVRACFNGGKKGILVKDEDFPHKKTE